MSRNGKLRDVVVVCGNPDCNSPILIKKGESSSICSCGWKITRKNKLSKNHTPFRCPETQAVVVRQGKLVLCKVNCGRRGKCRHNVMQSIPREEAQVQIQGVIA